MLPVQGLPALGCGCEDDAAQAAQPGRSVAQPAEAGCCYQPAEPVAAPSCGQAKAAQEPMRCACGSGCQCLHRDTAPEPKPVSTEHRVQITDVAIAPEVGFSPHACDSQSPSRENREPSALSGADRCILFCCFLF